MDENTPGVNGLLIHHLECTVVTSSESQKNIKQSVQLRHTNMIGLALSNTHIGSPAIRVHLL